jgi:hypothetical protein
VPRARTIVLGVVALAFLSGGASAFTAGNTVPNTTAGYGTSTISGATANSIIYTLNGPGTLITVATIKLTGDYHTGFDVRAGFGTDVLTQCTVGAYVNPDTTVVCTFGAGDEGDTAADIAFHMTVTNTT